jgi:serpin B
MTNQLLLKEIEKGSSFVSYPLSFHLTSSLVVAGSTGKTLEQLLSFLGTQYLGTQSVGIIYCQDYAACRGR